MDLAPTAEQEEARRDLAGLLARECSTAVVRRAEPLGFDRALWQKCQERLARALDAWRGLTGALLVGLADGALDLAVAHVSQREQFGVPIGSFQSVQHRLADLATERDGARLLVWEAAWAADAERARASALAALA